MPRRRFGEAESLALALDSAQPRGSRRRSPSPDESGLLVFPPALRGALSSVHPVVRCADDRRGSFRVDLEGAPVRVTAPGLANAQLTDLGAGGGGLLLPPDEATTADGRHATLELPGTAPVEVHLATVRAVPGAMPDRVRLGVRFGNLGRRSLGGLSRFLVARHREAQDRLSRLLGGSAILPTTDVRFVGRLLCHLLDVEGRTLRAYQGDRPLDTVLLGAPGGSLAGDALRLRVHGGPRPHAGRTHTFVLGGEVAACVFRTTVLSVRGAEVLLAMPTELRQGGFRDCFRARLGVDSGCRALLAHPRLAERTLDRPLLDVGAGGFSLPLRTNDHLLFPGDRLDELRVQLPTGLLGAVGVVRWIAPSEAGDHLAGVELTSFASRRDADLWNRFVFRATHPRLREGPTASVEDAWRALETSTYVSLWTSEDKRAHLSSEYDREWRRLPRDAGHLLVLGAGEKVAATCAGSRLYPRTWMVHHFGIDPNVAGSKRAWAREIYSGFLYAFQHMTTLDFLTIYVEEGKGWNELMYETFVARHPHPEDLAWTPFVVYRRDAAISPVPHALGAGVRVDQARVGDPRLAVLAAHLQATSTPLEVRAHGYDEDDLLLTPFEEECAALRYERTRRIFWAYEEGKVGAALIAETGGEGVNIFGLLNRCWIVPLGSERPSEGVTAALLDRAAAHYRAAGKKELLFFGNPDDDRALLERLGFQHVSPGMRWLSHRRVLPAWLAYVGDVLGFRSERSKAT